MKVLLADSLATECKDILTRAGLEVVTRPGISQEELKEEIKGYEGVILRSGVKITDKVLAGVVARLQKRGIKHPYIKSFVLARCNPLTRARKTLPSFDQALERLTASLEKFDPAAVRVEDVARAAAFAGGD